MQVVFIETPTIQSLGKGVEREKWWRKELGQKPSTDIKYSHHTRPHAVVPNGQSLKENNPTAISRIRVFFSQIAFPHFLNGGGIQCSFGRSAPKIMKCIAAAAVKNICSSVKH